MNEQKEDLHRRDTIVFTVEIQQDLNLRSIKGRMACEVNVRMIQTFTRLNKTSRTIFRDMYPSV